jgi:hypothetical protein
LLARRDGVNKTAATLHLDGDKLKRRMPTADATARLSCLRLSSLWRLERTADRPGTPSSEAIYGQAAHSLEGRDGGPVGVEPVAAWRVIQLVQQFRILVATEAIKLLGLPSCPAL